MNAVLTNHADMNSMFGQALLYFVEYSPNQISFKYKCYMVPWGKCSGTALSVVTCNQHAPLTSGLVTLLCGAT